MDDRSVEQIFINFSKRSVKILDNEGYDKTVTWKMDMEGAAGFSETVSELGTILDPDMVTYCFAEL